MPNEITQEKPTYLVLANGELEPNAAAVEAMVRYEQALKDQQRVDTAYAGAILVQLFLQHAWLDAVTLSLSMTSEHDDSGGPYRCAYCNALELRVVPNQPLPEDLRCEGEFNFDAAADFVKNELEDDEFGLYAGLAVDPNGCGELTVSLERRAIAALLQQTPIDGYLAVQAWKLVHGV